MATAPFVGAAFPLVCTYPHIASTLRMNRGGCTHIATAYVCNIT